MASSHLLLPQLQHLRFRKASAGLCLSSLCCPRSPSTACHPHSSCSGISNLRVSGISREVFGQKLKMQQDRLHFRMVKARDGRMDENPADFGPPRRTMRVLEHVVLFKMTESLTDELEMEMLDNLWSLQYRIKNILCSTVGRLLEKTREGYTHALFSRFPTKDALENYLENPIQWQVSQDLVIPYYDGKLEVDFEADVEDDLETVFRRGDEFQEGLEHMMFFNFKDNVSSDAVEKVLKTASALPEKHPELVQLTIGTNLDVRSKATFSHGLVARLPSELAYREYEEALQKEPSWIEAMDLFESSKTLTAGFRVTPVGKAVM